MQTVLFSVISAAALVLFVWRWKLRFAEEYRAGAGVLRYAGNALLLLAEMLICGLLIIAAVTVADSFLSGQVRAGSPAGLVVGIVWMMVGIPASVAAEVLFLLLHYKRPWRWQSTLAALFYALPVLLVIPAFFL